jgi:hypothetical protein
MLSERSPTAKEAVIAAPSMGAVGIQQYIPFKGLIELYLDDKY